MKLGKPITRSLFESITSPADLDSVQQMVGDMKMNLQSLVDRYLPRLSSIPLYQGVSWAPTWKSLPTFKQMNQTFLKEGMVKREDKRFRNVQSSFPAFFSNCLVTRSSLSLFILEVNSGHLEFDGRTECGMHGTIIISSSVESI